MDKFGLLAKRDIFGIILPGIIVVLVITFVISGTLNLIGSSIDLASLLSQQFLLSLLLFVAAYLVGSLLRLVASDDVDKEASKNILNNWEKAYSKHDADIAAYKKCHVELAVGKDVPSVPEGFDDWLWRIDQFPYAGWQNRKWQALNFRDVLNFYRENYKEGMWPSNSLFSKSFFNYCKLVIAKNNRELTDEVNMAEGLTRFFAGTVLALRISNWLLGFFLVLHISFAFIEWFFHLPITADISRWQIFYFSLTTILLLVLLWVQRRIVDRFRFVRLKEAETVYHSFYLCTGNIPEREKASTNQELKAKANVYDSKPKQSHRSTRAPI